MTVTNSKYVKQQIRDNANQPTSVGVTAWSQCVGWYGDGTLIRKPPCNDTDWSYIQSFIAGLTQPEATDEWVEKHKAANSMDGDEKTKAVLTLLIQQLNTLRSLHGLPAITKQQAIDAIKSELTS